MWRFALLLGVTGVIGAGLWAVTRPRGRALAGYMPFETSADFHERLVESRERPQFFKKTADRVNEVAAELAREGTAWGGRKVYISDVAKRLGATTQRIAGILLVANNRGWVELSRGDLTWAMDLDKIKASEIESPEGLSRYHFVVVPG